MSTEIIINATLPEIRVATLEDGEIVDLVHEHERNKGVVGNVYKGKVTRVLPGMQAAFVDIGLERAAFLYAGEVVTGESVFSFRKDFAVEEHSSKMDSDSMLDIDPGAYIEEKNVENLEESEVLLDEEVGVEKGKRITSGKYEKNQRGVKRGARWVADRPQDIAESLQEGQEILVQVTKEQIGSKGARLTCHIALPGRHVVLMPTTDHVGVSRKIASAEERARLKACINQLRPPGIGFIIRTMAESASLETITNEVNYLLSLYNEIKNKAQQAKAPSLLYDDLDITLCAVRDYFTDDIYRLVIDSPRVYDYICNYAEKVAPHLKNRIVRYTGKDPIFDTYGINSEISRALNRKVWLKSGGYLIIDQAEALTVVDVNTGKFIGQKSFEETIFKTNLEAVKEVAYQLRIRGVGGIIIIDLIDMEKSFHREQVYRTLEQALWKDKAKTNIFRISELGLIQMTRKRTKESLNSVSCIPCPYCGGNGFIKNIATICYDIFREIERTALEGGITGANIISHPEVADYLYQSERETLDRLEERFGIKITIQSNASFHLEAYDVFGERLSVGLPVT